MQKLGMKPVPGITRVTIKKSKNVNSKSHMVDDLVCQYFTSIPGIEA